jgi:hypothetical protein
VEAILLALPIQDATVPETDDEREHPCTK